MRPTGISYRLWWRHNDITMTSSIINSSRRAVRTNISVWYYWNLPVMSIRAQFIGRRFFVVIRGYTRSNAVQLFYAVVRGWTWLDAVEQHGSRLILEIIRSDFGTGMFLNILELGKHLNDSIGIVVVYSLSITFVNVTIWPFHCCGKIFL